jgi:hypothetical protein
MEADLNEEKPHQSDGIIHYSPVKDGALTKKLSKKRRENCLLSGLWLRCVSKKILLQAITIPPTLARLLASEQISSGVPPPPTGGIYAII